MTIWTDGIRVRRGQTLEEFQSGFGEYLTAKVGQAFDDSATTSLYKMSELSGAELGAPDITTDPLGNPIFSEFNDGPDSPQLDHATAMQRIKESGLEGRLTIPETGLPERAVQILIDRKHAELQRQSAIERAPNRYAVAGLPAAIATQILDPINVASMFIPVVGEQRFAAIAGKTGGRALAGLANGLIGSAAVEPFTYLAHTQEQADYTAADSLTNIAFGGILGGGLHVGIGALADRFWRDALRGGADTGEVPRGTAGEQRTDIEQRARIEAMPEAKQQSEIEWLRAEKQRLENELGTDELTGLRNRRAFAKDEQLPVKAMLDVDSLKWVNDTLGHDAGDAYLKAVGDAMRRAGIDGYRLSGDEFAYQARTPAEADALHDKLQNELQKVSVEATLPDGTKITKQGAGVSYGRGADRAEADANLYRQKAERGAAGLRPTERGAEPAGVVRVPAAGNQAAVHSAADVAAAVDWQTRQAALRTAVAQMADGRAPEVDALIRTDANAPGERATLANVQTAAERSASPAGAILDTPARSAEPVKSPATTAEAITALEQETAEAETTLRETLAGIEAQTGREGLADSVKEDLAEFDELVKDADTYGKALRAAALCEARS